jgi:glycogen synthase
MQNAMAQNFSWDVSAEKYLDVYERARAVRAG